MDEINLLKNDILSQFPPSTPNSSRITNYVPFATDNSAPKQSFTEFSSERRENALVGLSDGTYINRYDKYYTGVNNEELNAASQSTTDKWVNGLAKFGTKTFNAVLGGTVGIVYGIGKMTEDGSLTALYDNDFTQTLNDWDTKLNYTLPNYYTQQEQNKNLGGQLLTANFWSDKVLGGLSFTAGAIVSEGIWAWATGGASLGSTAARLGARAPWATRAIGLERVAQGVNRSKGLLREPLLKAFEAGKISQNTAIALGKVGDLANTTRFMITSAGYEASVEALQFRKEQSENFYNTFSQQYNRIPTSEEAQEFENNLEKASNAVFGLNLGLVGSSNLVTMGNIVGLKNPINTGIAEFVEKKAFGRGITQSAEGAMAITATKPQRIAGLIFDYGKAPITEGIYEEGGQGVVQKTAGKWLEHGYNPQYASENTELAGLVYESLAEQYGTKEGWVENGVGMIIGALGGSVNVRAGEQQRTAEQNYRIAGLNSYNEKIIGERFLMANRMSGFAQEAETERQKGNIVGERIATDGVLHAKINHSYQLGEDLNTLVIDARTALNTMTPQQFLEAGVETENIESYKTQVLADYKTTIDNFKKNRKFAEYTIGRSNFAGMNEVISQGNSELATNNREALVQALTWNLTAGENSLSLMNSVRQQLSSEIGDAQSKTINTVQQLQEQEASIQNEVFTLRNQFEGLSLERDNLQKSILEIQNTPRETEGDRTAGTELGERNARLLEVENQIQETQNRLQSITDEINNQNSYKGSLNQFSEGLTVENLLNLTNDRDNLERFVNGFRNVNPQRHAYIVDLLDEYSKAQTLYRDNKKTVQMFTEGRVNIEQINSWLGKKLLTNRSMDENTRDWLIEILQSYQNNKVTSASQTIDNETITDEIYNDFIENDIVPQSIIEDIADKIIANEVISPREEQIRTAKTQEIESIIAQTPIPFSDVTIQPENLTPAEELRQRLENLLKRNYSSLTYIGTNYDDLSLKKPTRSEIEEYRNTDTSGERKEELRQKLGNWRLLDSAVSEDNQSIADLVDLIEQLETTVDNQSTLDELTQDDIATISQPNKGGVAETTVRYDLAQNTKGSVTVQILKNNTYKFSHLKMSSIVNALNIPIERTKMMVNDKVAKRPNFENYFPGTIFYLDNLKITIGAGNTIEMTPEVYNSVKDVVDLNIVIPSVNWSYFDVYETNGRKKPSDFEESINPQEIYNVKPEDSLTLRIAQDSFNEGLRNQSPEQIERQLKIEIVHNGQAVSTLKATNTTVAPNENFLLLRQSAANAFINNQPFSAKIKARRIFLGSPQITTENLQSVNIDITETAASKIISTGYVENGRFTLSRELENIDRTYISGLRADDNLKIPVIIFRKGVYNVAYPVSLKKSALPMAERITSIIENTELTPTDKVKAINAQIIETGIATDKRLSKYDEQQIQEIINDFSENQTFVSMDSFSSPNYRIQNTIADISINIDLNNLDQVISDPKLEIDLNSIQVGIDRVDRFDSMIEVEDRLSQLSSELYSDYVQNADAKYINTRGLIIEDTTYTNAFDENVVESNASSNIQKQANIRILRQAFSERIPSNLEVIIGKNTIEEVRRLLKKYDMLRNQTVPNRQVAQEIIEENICQ